MMEASKMQNVIAKRNISVSFSLSEKNENCRGLTLIR